MSRQPAVYTAHPIDAKIDVDGRLDEAPWQRPPTFELEYETRPAENGPAPVRTEVWIGYDPNNLYVAFRAHDPEPEKIRARLSDRDNAYQDDFVGVVLDTFNDQRRAFEFFVNPLGVQMDMTQNEMTGGEDDSWDAIWDSAGRITDTGYIVEMRIPFSSLRFPKAEDGMTWGIDAVRFYPRGQRHRLALHPLERGNNCYLCQGYKLVGFEGVKPARSIELDPTLTASMSGAREDFPDGEMVDGNPDVEPGITAHWGITPNLILTGALNPDFSQVEADAAQLDVNTQFALFYPEKRPFFLEGADIFATRFNAIYSRNIADPDWGIKLTGKVGKDAIGVIIAQDSMTNLLIPSSQSSALDTLEEDNLSTIVRYRRDLFGATTGGFFYTGREGDDYSNRLFGGDILFRWKDTEAARIEILGSQTRYPEEIAEELRPEHREAHGLCHAHRLPAHLAQLDVLLPLPGRRQGLPGGSGLRAAGRLPPGRSHARARLVPGEERLEPGSPRWAVGRVPGPERAAPEPRRRALLLGAGPARVVCPPLALRGRPLLQRRALRHRPGRRLR